MICPQAQLSEVVEALEARRPRQERPGTNALRYLLSGIARCGICQGPMRGQMRRRASGTQYQVYLCDRSGFARGCGKIARIGAPIDQLIVELVLADQKRAQLKAGSGGWSPEMQGRLDGVLADIQELREAHTARKISIKTLVEFIGPLEKERDQLALLKRRAEREGKKTKVVEHTREAFDALPLERQRALILRSLQAVIVHPQGKGVVKFNPDLIEPVWA